MINFDAVYVKLQKTIMDRVGTRLSTINGTELPAVVRAREAMTINAYPFVTVDIFDVAEVDGWLIDDHINNSDNTVYAVPKQLSIAIRCYGGSTGSVENKSALSICNAIQSTFMFEPLRVDFRQSLNAGIVEVTPIEVSPVKRSDTFVEMAYFYLVLSVVDEHEDTLTSQLITEVAYEGVVTDGVEGGQSTDADFSVVND